jgi:cytochrome c peroxidase
MNKKLFVTLLFAFAALNATANNKELLEEAKGIFKAMPKQIIDANKHADMIALGKSLYFEKKLSINDKISCNSCHQLDNFGVDNEPTSPGHDGTRGGRNSPTVYNTAFNFAQFWDGRAKDLAAQAVGPILNPIEHGLKSEADAMKKIDSKKYRAMFAKAFGNKKSFTYSNIGVAIGEFEKTLITPSRFDDFLRGDLNALSKVEKQGLRKFMDVGCTSCHNGVNMGGNSYQVVGLINSYDTKDLGRYEITKKEEDKKAFKVPTLRNITKTGPYFHDGKVASLDEAIKLMAYHQLGETLSNDDTKLIKTFLKSLEAKKLPKM